MKISEIITDKYKLRIPPTVYYELLADVVEAEEEQEPNIKNDLGVDCVARQDIERYIEGFVNEYTPKEELEFINLELDGLKHIPSVTPQEPILDELRAEITTLQNRCYALTKGTMCAFCKYECEYKAETEDT